jgi:hypothetical protein
MLHGLVKPEVGRVLVQEAATGFLSKHLACKGYIVDRVFNERKE